MRRLNLFLILFGCVLIPKVNAQQFNHGFVVDGSPVKSRGRNTFSHIDKEGNRIIGNHAGFSNFKFILDGRLYASSIHEILFVNKYDSLLNVISGLYFHTVFDDERFPSPKFVTDSNNNTYILCTISFDDSLFAQTNLVNVIDADSNIIYQYHGSGWSVDSNDKYNLILLCFNANGILQWGSTIGRQGQNAYSIVGPNAELYVNHLNQVVLITGNVLRQANSPLDTFKVITNQTDTQRVVGGLTGNAFKYTANGTFLGTFNPYYSQFKQFNNTFTPNGQRLTELITKHHGNKAFSLVEVLTQFTDTFLTGNIALQPGRNILLIERTNDSITSARLVGNAAESAPLRNVNLAYVPERQEVLYGFSFVANQFTFGHNFSVFPVNNYEAYFCSVNTNTGNLNWQHTLLGSTDEWISGFDFNPLTDTYVLFGITHGYDFSFGNLQIFDAYSINGYPFMVSLNQSGQPINVRRIANNNVIGFGINVNFPNRANREIIDPMGRVIFTGGFTGTINLDCGGKVIPPPALQGSRQLFQILTNAIYKIDTQVCKTYTSPSGKYQITKTGVYFDTIPTANGCDSVFRLEVKVRSTLDTLIKQSCKPLTSPSGKYVWDSTGTYVDTLLTTTGCDSVLVFKLSINNNKSQISISSCLPLQSPSKKYTYFTSGIYHDTIPNQANCDSVITILFNRFLVYDSVEVFACKPIYSPSGKYILNKTGWYVDTVLTNAQCDSVLFINFTYAGFTDSVSVNFCNTFTMPWSGAVITQSGIYTDSLIGSFGCDSVLVISATKIPLTLSLNKSNNIICDSLFSQLTTTSNASNYVWQPTEWLNQSDQAIVIATPKQSTLFFVTATDTLGCSATDSIWVEVNKEETINQLPNVFTPNQDGKNDCLPLTHVAAFAQASFDVFNRWGTLVYSSTNPTDCWLGVTNSGEKLPAGVYYFILKGKTNCNQNVLQKGSITVIPE